MLRGCPWPAHAPRRIGLVTVLASLAVTAPAQAVQEFTNPSGITINTATTAGPSVAATPYPSRIDVTGGPTSIERMTVKIYGVAHPFVGDLDVLLLSPQGDKTLLMSDVGSGSSVSSTFTFDDAAPTSLTDQSDVGFSGTYKPSDISATAFCVGPDSFPLPAPQAWVGPPDLARFNGEEANGFWDLYVVDDCQDRAGSIVQWSVNFYARVSLSVSTNGEGMIVSSPAGINCGLTCGHSYFEDDTVTLTATPAVGWRFTGWNLGVCSNAGTTCQVRVTPGMPQIIANFDFDDPPVAADDVAVVAHDAPFTSFDVRANDTDPEGDRISVTSVSDPAHGQTAIVGGSLGYQPDPGYCNDPDPGPTDDFTYTLNGGSTATVRVTVTCPTPPTATRTNPDPGSGSTPSGSTPSGSTEPGTGGGAQPGTTQTGPGQAPVAPLALPSGKVVFRRGRILLRLHCRAATRCRGTLRVTSRRSGSPRAAAAGRARFNIAAGRGATIKAQPTRALLNTLRRRGRANATVVAKLTGLATPFRSNVRVVRRR